MEIPLVNEGVARRRSAQQQLIEDEQFIVKAEKWVEKCRTGQMPEQKFVACPAAAEYFLEKLFLETPDQC